MMVVFLSMFAIVYGAYGVGAVGALIGDALKRGLVDGRAASFIGLQWARDRTKGQWQHGTIAGQDAALSHRMNLPRSTEAAV